MTNAEKLAVIRRFYADTPDIYALADQGFTPNGCGPDGWLGKIIPDNPVAGVDLAPVWDWHDWRYWRGGDEQARQAADEGLRRMIIHAAPRWRLFRRWQLRVVADLYYECVRSFGSLYFNYPKGSKPCPDPSLRPALLDRLTCDGTLTMNVISCGRRKSSAWTCR